MSPGHPVDWIRVGGGAPGVEERPDHGERRVPAGAVLVPLPRVVVAEEVRAGGEE